MELLVTKDTLGFKEGDIINPSRTLKEGAYSGDNFISRKNYIVLKESLTNEDLAIINTIIKKKFSILFWRLYTRSQFLLK